MRSIPPLSIDAAILFDQIASAKRPARRAQMRAVRAEILAAYQGYEDAAPEVGGLDEAPLNDLQKEVMQHAFTVETKPMTGLRGNLMGRICVAKCPFCGIGESSTLDHYLPKEQYPEFSVFPMNLVPSCAVCNTRKGDRILDERTMARMFLHPYYDVVPDMAFLEVCTSMQANALILSYRLTQPDGMGPETFQHLRSHFIELDLADRYRRMGLEHLGGQCSAFRRAYGHGKDAKRVAEMLIEGAEGFEEWAGPNYWLAKLYRALADNEDFCDGGFEVVQVQLR